MIDASALWLGRAVFDLLFESALKAAVLALPVWLAFQPVRSQRPAIEHGVWTATLCGMLLLPLLCSWSAGPVTTSLALQAPLPVLATLTAKAKPVTPSLDWRSIAGLLMATGSALLVLRSLVAWRRVARIVDRAREVSAPAVHGLLHATGVPRILSSPEVSTPVACGLLRPAIVLPMTWPEWGRTKLHAVLAHERAHIGRRDSWIMAAALLNTAVFWFHPVAWVIRSRLRTLAELACDDQAIRSGRDPERYAEALLEIARDRKRGPSVPAATVAMARSSRVARRVERILGNSEFQCGVLSRTVWSRLAIAVGTAAALLSLVSVSPGQPSGVTLSGSVRDASGARVPHALVLITDTNRNATEAASTGADGSFRIDGLLPAQSCEVRVQAVGFSRWRDSIDLTADRHLDIAVEVEPVEEAIVVAGTRARVDAAAPRAKRQRIRIGGNVQQAKLLLHVQPVYPADAQQEGVEGTVLLEAVISKEGRPTGLKAVNSVIDQRLAEAAIEAVSDWRYAPARLNGQPVETVTTMNITFELP